MKKIIFILLLFALWIPKIQDELVLFSLKPLDGVTVSAWKPVFNFKQWWNGNYQTEFGNYTDETFGLRNFFIRLYNQLDYTLFKKAHGNIVIGKNDYLYQNEYINEYIGSNFIGDDAMKFNIDNLSKIERYLDTKNILMATILEPTKADYYKEYLPEIYARKIPSERNYYSFLEWSRKINIRLIDLNKWFLQLKDTSRYPLFPKQGIHWNFYGMALVADSITRYIEAEKNISLPKISWTLELPDTLRETDYDIGGLLNILQKLPYDKMPYPRFTIDSDTSIKKPSLLVVGDSFYWTIYNERVFNRVFDNETFIYYNSTISPADRYASRNPYDLNILKEVEKFDVVLLLQSSGNYGNPGLGFIYLLTDQLNRREKYKIKAVTHLEKDNTLINRTNQIASSYKISADSAKAILSDSIVEQMFEDVSRFKLQMRSSDSWMKQLYEKAATSNKSIEHVMQDDAEWMCDQQFK